MFSSACQADGAPWIYVSTLEPYTIMAHRHTYVDEDDDYDDEDDDDDYDDEDQIGRNISLTLELKGGVTYVLETGDERTGGVYSVSVGRERRLVSLSATLKDPSVSLPYGLLDIGWWVPEEHYFSFDEEAVRSLFEYTLHYDVGTEEPLDAEDIMLSSENQKDWGPGKENVAKLELSWANVSCEVTVPICSIREYYKDAPVWDGKETLSLSYDPEGPSSPIFFTCEKEGTYRLLATSKEDSYNAYVVCEADSGKLVGEEGEGNTYKFPAEAGVTYAFFIRNVNETACEYEVSLQEAKKVTALYVTKKEEDGSLLYVEETIGSIPSTDQYYFFEVYIKTLYDFEAEYEDGERRKIAPLDIEWEYIDEPRDWGPGKENQIWFVFEEAKAYVQVPLHSIDEYVQNLPRLTLGQKREVSYDGEAEVSVCFVPDADGYYAFSSSHEGEETPIVTLRDGRTFERMGRDAYSAENGSDFLLKKWLEAGVPYIVSVEDAENRAGTISIFVEETKVMLKLDVSLRKEDAYLIYEDETSGYRVENEDEEPYFYYRSADILHLCRFVGQDSEGETRELDLSEVSVSYETPLTEWSPEGENEVVFSVDEAEASFQVPIKDIKECRDSFPRLSLDEETLVPYEGIVNVRFLFTPERDGYYQFSSIHEGNIDPVMYLFDAETMKFVMKADDEGGRWDFFGKVSLQAGKSYLVSLLNIDYLPGSYSILAEETRG
ncbi:MAG: hypothetical protein IIZ39_00005, partial [Blautia sp.]|nr:hypothetical protein [Blautia sp.]